MIVELCYKLEYYDFDEDNVVYVEVFANKKSKLNIQSVIIWNSGRGYWGDRQYYNKDHFKLKKRFSRKNLVEYYIRCNYDKIVEETKKLLIKEML